MTSVPLKRKRARVACEPCRSRKRKCDGADPCGTCRDWGYECYYAAAPSSGYKTTAPPSEPPGSTAPPGGAGIGGAHHRPAIDPQRVARSLTANSSAVFVRKMGLKVDPANAPRVNLFAWNVGARRLSSGLVPATAGLPLVDLVPLGSMRQLAEVYFAKVDPCYGFIDQQAFFQRLNARWSSSSSGGGGGRGSIYDSVLAGVAALGLLFSERTASAAELQLIETAKAILESYDGCAPPSLDLITGWVLRVVYMRMTATPYSTWLASSTVVHLIEAAGLHHEDPNPPCSADVRRRLVGVALHQNMWPSYDIGLSRVPLKANLSPSLDMAPRPGDYTTELLGLLPISARLDPEQAPDSSDSDLHLHRALFETLDRTHTQPPSILAQTNVVLCMLRRLNLLNINTSPTLPDRILSLFRQALQSARTMLAACCPWQHIANVPFHIITILLEMDTCASLALLPEAMQTVKMVASTYNTPTMREAYTTARFLIFVYQQRRSRDVRLLNGVLDADGQPQAEPEPGSVRNGTQAALPRSSPNLDEMPLLEELVADMSELQELDFDQFLSLDMLRSA
ncbi:hypothetical protein BDW71DRAFT_207527 [Aspergillus fruticulosus]